MEVARTEINGWMVYDNKNKPMIETLQDYPETAKSAAEIYFDKGFSILGDRGFSVRKVRLYILER